MPRRRGLYPRLLAAVLRRTAVRRSPLNARSLAGWTMRARRYLIPLAALVGVVGFAHASRSDDGGIAAADEDEPRCEERESTLRLEFDKFVGEHNSCRADRDCAVVLPGCPFGCYRSVAKADGALVKDRARQLAGSMGDCRCFYKCLPPSRPLCKHNRCQMAPRP